MTTKTMSDAEIVREEARFHAKQAIEILWDYPPGPHHHAIMRWNDQRAADLERIAKRLEEIDGRKKCEDCGASAEENPT